MIFVLLLSACGPATPTGSAPLPELQVGASPTVIADATAATQSTDPEAPIVPTVPAIPSFDVRLTTVNSGAKIIRSGGNPLEVQEDEVVDVEAEEGIEVVKPEGQEEQGYSILDFSDDLEVELFSNTSVFLAALRQQVSGSSDVTLHLEGGQIFVHLNELTDAQIVIQTPAATIRTLTGGTEFDVCHNEGLTCIFVKKGVVEVTAKNRTELVKVGEAIHILKDQRPSSTICAPIAQFTSWEDEYRQFAETPTLENELAQLPQEPCPLDAAGLPVNARILYQDQFINPFGGWARGRVENFTVRYAGLRFFRIQAQSANVRHLASVPDERVYEDVNIDIHAIANTVSGGDFRYGIAFRRTENQFYAFVISPVTKTWYFLKNTSSGPEILKEGTEDRIDGLDSREMLRVEAYGSTFLLFIKGRLIDWVSDTEYASGEVALFVETLHNPDAEIRFDSIAIWDMPTVIDTDEGGGREYCFNGFDDDGDRLADRADPDCQRLGKTATPLPQSTNTSIAPRTSTPQATNTLLPPHTSTPRPPTLTPIPADTNTPRPTRTRTPIPPATNTPRPTNTRTPIPPATNTPVPNTSTSQPPTDPPTNPPPTDPPPTDPPPTDPPPTDPPPTDPPPTDPPPTDPPATDPPVIDPPPTDPPTP